QPVDVAARGDALHHLLPEVAALAVGYRARERRDLRGERLLIEVRVLARPAGGDALDLERVRRHRQRAGAEQRGREGVDAGLVRAPDVEAVAPELLHARDGHLPSTVLDRAVGALA